MDTACFLGFGNGFEPEMGLVCGAVIAHAHIDSAAIAAAQALDRVGILDKARVRASHLSGGQRQRVGIARALAQEPSLILADEPVASLDPPTSHVVMRYLKAISSDLGITTLVNLHFLDLATAYADRIIGLRAGELVFDGPGSECDAAVFESIYGRSLTADDTMETRPSL